MFFFLINFSWIGDFYLSLWKDLGILMKFDEGINFIKFQFVFFVLELVKFFMDFKKDLNICEI